MLFDPHRRWSPRAICTSPEDAKLFFVSGGLPRSVPSAPVQAKWDRAKEICGMCPVLEQCQRDTLGEEYGVWGGRDPHERYLIRKRLSRAVKRWPEGRQYAWGKQLSEMRDAGLYWRTVLDQTGFPRAAAEHLITYYQEHKPKQIPRQIPRVVDLELPAFTEDREVFPDRPGRKSAWVRHQGRIADAWYRGQTPDGLWINVAVAAGRGSSNKWIKAEDMRLYRPEPVVILNYASRPDGDHAPAA